MEGSASPSLPGAFVRAVADAVGPAALVTDPDLLAGHEVDWTGRFRGRAAAMVRPHDVEEVAALVRAARTSGVALVPQGGNTGLAGGAVPSEGSVVVDLRRFDVVSELDATGGQLTAGAGTTIATVQAAAASLGWSYGVDWAARGSATIGGSVATNAGGLRFVRHGGTRQQLLGVEAVLGTGDIVRHLPRVEKDNTGYHLPGLLCGSEGTLGIITRVRSKLVAPDGPVATALVAFGSVPAAVDAASRLRRELPLLDAVELVLAPGLDLVCRHTGRPRPFDPLPIAALLIESGDAHDPQGALGAVVAGLAGVVDAAVAVDDLRRRELWRYREAHTEAIAGLGAPHKLDVTLPIEVLAAFIEEAPALVRSVAEHADVWLFGHAADGNVHVNVTGVEPGDDRVDDVVLTRVAAWGGSISAEHGIGRAKRRWLHLVHGASEIAAMRSVKAALDPDGILNPGVLLPDAGP
jgi:FAD/FMN-containing dehydrogenase